MRIYFKKVITYFMAVIMVLTIAGCSGGEEKQLGEPTQDTQIASKNGGIKEAEGADSAAGFDEDPSHIVVAYFCESGIPLDLKDVQTAINEITLKEINVEVELKVFEAGNYSQQLGLMLNSGEQLDLAHTFPAGAVNFASLKSQNLIMPMKELLTTYAPETMDLMGDALVAGTAVDGDIYGLTINNDKALSFYWIARKDILEKYNLLDRAQNAKGWSDLEDIFQVVRDNEPSLAPVINGTNYHVVNAASIYFDDVFGSAEYIDVLGDSTLMIAGVNTKAPDELISNYESDAYKNMIHRMADWYSKGYIYKDASMNQESPEQIIRSNIGFSWFGTGNPSEIAAKSESAGYELFALELAPCMINAANSRNFTWFVPTGSQEPEAAVKFLNMLYTDSRIINLLNYGIENKHYIVNKDGTVSLPEGKTAENVGYYTTSDFLFGTVFLAYPREGLDTDYRNQRWEVNKSAIHSPSSGFSFDSRGLENEITALTNVVLEYCPALETGSSDNVDAVYEKFIEKLYASGAQDLLDAFEEQYAAFRAAK